MRRLDSTEVAKLTNRVSVKKVAVENFLMSTPGHITIHDAIGNLALDARVYGWNDATCTAIYEGLIEMYNH